MDRFPMGIGMIKGGVGGRGEFRFKGGEKKNPKETETLMKREW